MRFLLTDQWLSITSTFKNEKVVPASLTTPLQKYVTVLHLPLSPLLQTLSWGTYISLSYAYVNLNKPNAHLAKILERKGGRLERAKHFHSPEGKSHSNPLVILLPGQPHEVHMSFPWHFQEGQQRHSFRPISPCLSVPIKWSSLFSAVS